MKKVGLKIEEAADRTRWKEGMRAIAEGIRCIRPPLVTRKNRIKTGLMMMMMNSLQNILQRRYFGDALHLIVLEGCVQLKE